jgi:DNA processing protein
VLTITSLQTTVLPRHLATFRDSIWLLFVIPNNYGSRSHLGANRLIQDGAKLVLETADVLEELNLHMAPQQMELAGALPENDAEARVLAELGASGEPRHVDELVRATALPAAAVAGTLVMLELKGLALLVGSMTYVRAR